MALPHVNAGELITSAAWNNMVDEFNTKINKVGNGIIAGSLFINGLAKAHKLEITDPATGVTFPDTWIGMAQNIEAATKWLHIGGITDSAVRRIALFADRTFVSGNLGIGITNPTQRLEVNGGIKTQSLTFNTASNTGNSMSITRTDTNLQLNLGFSGLLIGGTPLTYNFQVGYTSSFFVIGQSPFVETFSVNQNGDGKFTGSLTVGGSDLYFTQTNHSHTGFGNTNGFAAIENAAAPYNALMILGRSIGTGGTRVVKLWDYLEVNGTAAKTNGGPWAGISDKKLKKNIKTIDGALNKLTQLRGVNFEWKDEDKMGGHKGIQTGMIAQEVELIFPEWVINDVNGNKAIGFFGFEALMVESLKELKSEINKIKEHLKI